MYGDHTSKGKWTVVLQFSRRASQLKPPALVANFETAPGEVGSLTQSLWVISSQYQIRTTVVSEK